MTIDTDSTGPGGDARMTLDFLGGPDPGIGSRDDPGRLYDLICRELRAGLPGVAVDRVPVGPDGVFARIGRRGDGRLLRYAWFGTAYSPCADLVATRRVILSIKMWT